MSAIGQVAVPSEDTAAGKYLRMLLEGKPPSSAIQKSWEIATSRLLAQIHNGAGLPMDSRLRYFLQEYNDRTFKHGLDSMPASFNVLEAFVEYCPELNYFRLREEIDHIVSFVDFLDFATSPAATGDVTAAVELLKEGAVYSYNSTNLPGDITFSVRSGEEYGVGGLSLVRHAKEVSVMLLAGERTDTVRKTAELREATIDPNGWSMGRGAMRPAKGRVRDAVPLLGDPDFWETLVFARYDFVDRSEDARYVMKDAGDMFTVLSDDVSLLLDPRTGEFERTEYEAMAKRMVRDISEYATLFELCRTFLLLPAYFEENEECLKVERHPTRFAADVKKHRNAKKRGKTRNLAWISKQKCLTSAERISCRNVMFLDTHSELDANNTLYRAPDFHVQVSGYWKTLPINESGVDKHGNPIHGRTWVRKELSWVQKQEGILVHAERRGKANADVVSESGNENPGYIYVMHNAAHDKDIFKVGLTRRTSELRADELSGTGAPDRFFVAHDWWVRDCVGAERYVHRALDAYRVNPKREFFRLPYQELLKTISSVLEDFK